MTSHWEPSTALSGKPRTGRYKMRLSCLEGSAFKSVESKIHYGPDVSDPEKMPWIQNYPENVQYSVAKELGMYAVIRA